MTNITELAQRMRTAAEKAGVEQWVNNRGEVNTADYEVDGGAYIDHICDCEIVGTESPRAEFIAMANPANVIDLVEALEKAQRYIEELREWNAGLAQESCERQQRISELLEGKVGNALLERENHHVELVGKLAERIAELESRTVKLPPCVDDLHGIGMVMPADAVIEMLAAAGIKVEAE
ncbi:RelE family toxin-antitoxin system [Klebsiella quasipneumoniae]|uniref:ead/Ea22-like family protein n=1 Tax=Klebsiella quasipneumoniae TaxID=1463165 RepID=UPI0009BB6BAD|nr:ead/Ea22-like family protein [Klebsiella quasipneumoniae]SLQ74568.1 RelE family toxin-antitoxin system [Klebsiella quasipneumoniae]